MARASARRSGRRGVVTSATPAPASGGVVDLRSAPAGREDEGYGHHGGERAVLHGPPDPPRRPLPAERPARRDEERGAHGSGGNALVPRGSRDFRGQRYPRSRPYRGAMQIAIGADHAGFPLKVHLVAHLTGQGHDVLDLGTHSTDPVDYPAYC